MAETTFSFKDAAGTTKTALAGQNGSSQLAPAAVLYDASGAELKGQKAMAASVPVVVASNQSDIPISAASLPLPSGAATAANQATANTSLAAIDGKLHGSVAAAAGDKHAPASNTAAIVTYAASVGVSHVISGVAWSYDGDPTGGNLKIEDGASTVFSMDITSKGAGFIPFPFPKKGTANTALIITLAAGGSGVTGKVSVLNHWVE